MARRKSETTEDTGYENQSVEVEIPEQPEEYEGEWPENLSYTFVDDEELGPRIVAGADDTPMRNAHRGEDGSRYLRVPRLPAKVMRAFMVGNPPSTVALYLENGGTFKIPVALD